MLRTPYILCEKIHGLTINVTTFVARTACTPYSQSMLRIIGYLYMYKYVYGYYLQYCCCASYPRSTLQATTYLIYMYMLLLPIHISIPITPSFVQSSSPSSSLTHSIVIHIQHSHTTYTSSITTHQAPYNITRYTQQQNAPSTRTASK